MIAPSSSHAWVTIFIESLVGALIKIDRFACKVLRQRISSADKIEFAEKKTKLELFGLLDKSKVIYFILV